MYIYVRSVVIASHSWRCVLDTTLCDKVCHWLTAARWFSSGTPVSSTNRTDRHDITEILFKVHGVKYHNPNRYYLCVYKFTIRFWNSSGGSGILFIFYYYYHYNNEKLEQYQLYVHVIPATKDLEIYTPSTLSTTNYNSVLIHLEFI
jgi:hypothetical protein